MACIISVAFIITYFLLYRVSHTMCDLISLYLTRSPLNPKQRRYKIERADPYNGQLFLIELLCTLTSHQERVSLTRGRGHSRVRLSL